MSRGKKDIEYLLSAVNLENSVEPKYCTKINESIFDIIYLLVWKLLCVP